MEYPTLLSQDDFILACGLKQSTNTMPAAWEITGSFGRDQIMRAVELVLDGHESLRSCIVEKRGSFRQRVTGGGVSEHIRDVDLSREDRPDAQMKEMMDQLLAHPFDLRKPPLWRGFLARIGRRRWVLGLAIAHVIVDGAAVNVISRDLARALENGTGPSPLQLGAIAKEQRKLRATREQASWWEAQYHRRQGLPAFWHGKAHYRVEPIPVLEAPVVTGLGRLAQDLGASVSTLFGATTALAAGAVLGCPVPMLGFATAQRTPENEHTVGPLFDHLPVLGGEEGGSVPFATFVRNLHARRAMARESRLPCGLLANVARSTPYDIAVNYSPFAAPVPHRVGSRGAVRARPIPTIGRIAIYRATSVAPPVVAILRPGSDGTLSGDITGISELHGAEAVRALAAAVGVVAQRVLRNPETPIGQLVRGLS